MVLTTRSLLATTLSAVTVTLACAMAGCAADPDPGSSDDAREDSVTVAKLAGAYCNENSQDNPFQRLLLMGGNEKVFGYYDIGTFERVSKLRGDDFTGSTREIETGVYRARTDDDGQMHIQFDIRASYQFDDGTRDVSEPTRYDPANPEDVGPNLDEWQVKQVYRGDLEDIELSQEDSPNQFFYVTNAKASSWCGLDAELVPSHSPTQPTDPADPTDLSPEEMLEDARAAVAAKFGDNAAYPVEYIQALNRDEPVFIAVFVPSQTKERCFAYYYPDTGGIHLQTKHMRWSHDDEQSYDCSLGGPAGTNMNCSVEEIRDAAIAAGARDNQLISHENGAWWWRGADSAESVPDEC